MRKMTAIEYANKQATRIKNKIDGLTKEISDAENKIANLKNAIMELQQSCPHLVTNPVPRCVAESEPYDVCAHCGAEIEIGGW